MIQRSHDAVKTQRYALKLGNRLRILSMEMQPSFGLLRTQVFKVTIVQHCHRLAESVKTTYSVWNKCVDSHPFIFSRSCQTLIVEAGHGIY